MKKALVVFTVLLALTMFTGESLSALKGKANSKYLNPQETLKILQDMGITQGNPVTFVKSAETASKDWWVHLFKIQQGDAFMPLLTYVNKKDVVVGILIRDGKIVMPKIPVSEMQPTLNMSKLRVTSDNRKVYNVEGKEVLYMFTDESPRSQSIEQQLLAYKGRYKIIVKQFPLDQINPGAKERAIEKQCYWLNRKGCDSQTQQIAAKIVEEDIQEGTAIGVDALPFFLTQGGNILREIPDLKKN